MLEQLMGMIANNSQDAIVNNPAIPNEHNDSAMQTILSSVLGGMGGGQQGGGGTGGLMSILGGAMGNQGGGGMMSNPIVAGVAQNAIAGLMNKFGIQNAAAQGIVAQVLPGLLSQMSSAHSDSNNSFNLGDVTGALADGKLDMNDIMNIGGKLMGGGNAAGGNAGGGIGSLLGGLFGGK